MKILVARILGYFAVVLALGCASVQAQLSEYTFSNAFPGLTFSSPVCIAAPPGETNRLFVVEQDGVIVVITNLANPTRTVFLDINGRVDSGGELGLLGLAFHPGFATNRFFYVFYTGPANGGALHDILSRFQAWTFPWDPNMADPNSEVRLIVQRDDADNHNGGDLHFGPDGYLYVSLGDEGGGGDTFGNSQRIDNDFFSGILRLDVDKRPGSLPPNPHAASSTNYAVPPDNPYVGATKFNGSNVNSNNVRMEFWAVGLRNPWRMSFDPQTGFLYCGDVGQGAREEIDVIKRGGNYGWNYREGNIGGPESPPAGFTNRVDPIEDYDRGEGNCVIGGVVYRGTRFSDLIGYYIYSDIGSGNFWALTYNGTNATSPQPLFVDGGASAFGIDPRNGDVLYADLNESIIKRIVPATPSGSLQVTIGPSAANSDGARWQVDGGAFRMSGSTVSGLAVGEHTVSYKAIAGWTAPADQTISIEVGSTTTTNGSYVMIDASRPTLTITAPASGQRITNASFTATGATKDNVLVTEVLYQLNAGAWSPANTTNSWTNWIANLLLIPGTNVFRAYAVDSSGNYSTTNSVTFVYVLTAPLQIFINGSGTVTPDLDDDLLEIGKRYTLTAKPGKNFDFFTWSGSINTNREKLSFIMESNLVLIANFRDAKRPVVAITFPGNNRRITNALVQVAGKAKDNVALDSVWYKLNDLPNPASTTNQWTNWISAALIPLSGENLVEATAVDTAGNASLTHKVKFTYQPVPSADWAPDSLSGLIALVTPDSSPALGLSFDDFRFQQTGSSNAHFGVGNYLYSKTSTNTAQLSATLGGPPTRTNDPPFNASLIFTDHYSGIFSNWDGASGTIVLNIATNLAPRSLAKKKIVLRNSAGTNSTVQLSNHETFTQTPSRTGAGGSSSGAVLDWRYSPIGKYLVLLYADPEAGIISDIQLTFTSKNGGTYVITTHDGQGTVSGVDSGTFTIR